jgi:DNA-binding GntR family transcriptional regulator
MASSLQPDEPAMASLHDARAPEDGGGPIARQSLHEAIVSRIRDMITEATLPPGTRIHEGQLGQQLGVSRTPLREALKFLASEGLIELMPNRGAVVRRFTPKDVQDTLIVLGTLESLAGRLACAHASDAEIAEVRRVHDEMLRLYAARDRLRYFKLNQQIHSAIIALSGNETLVAVHAALQSRLKRIRFIGNEGPEKWQAAVADHEAMMTAFEARDPDAFATALHDHMARTWERVKDAV